MRTLLLHLSNLAVKILNLFQSFNDLDLHVLFFSVMLIQQKFHLMLILALIIIGFLSCFLKFLLHRLYLLSYLPFLISFGMTLHEQFLVL